MLQHVLERGTKEDREVIVKQMRGQIVPLSRHKVESLLYDRIQQLTPIQFASNVIDKVILVADEEDRRSITDEVLSQPMAIDNMLRDQVSYCVSRPAYTDLSLVCQLLFAEVDGA